MEQDQCSRPASRGNPSSFRTDRYDERDCCSACGWLDFFISTVLKGILCRNRELSRESIGTKNSSVGLKKNSTLQEGSNVPGSEGK